VPRQNILVHGVNKSLADIHSAIENAGTIVVDNLTELKRIHVILSERSERHLPRAQVPGRIPLGNKETLRSAHTVPASLRESDTNVWLRLLPGVPVRTHHSHTQTGQQESKFGMTPTEILEAARFCRAHDLPLNGIHFHQGSNFRDPEPLIPAIEMALDLAK